MLVLILDEIVDLFIGRVVARDQIVLEEVRIVRAGYVGNGVPKPLKAYLFWLRRVCRLRVIALI